MSKIKRGMNIPDSHHVIRHIFWNKLHKDENGNVLGILPQALALRECDEGNLSVNWVEYFEGAPDEKIINAIRDIRKAVKVGPKSGFGISTVYAIKETCKSTPKAIKVVYSPNSNNLSHSLIKYLPAEDMALLDTLSKEAFSKLILNSDIP